MNSLAHAALSRIQSGEVSPDRAIAGYNFDDGSKLVKHPALGWMVAECVSTCECAKGIEACLRQLREEQRIQRALAVEPSYVLRHRDGLVGFAA